MVRRAKRPVRHQPFCRIKHSRNGVNLGRLECLLEPQRRQNRWQPLCKHRFAGAWRPDHQDVVSTSRRHFERALRHMLPTHVFEVMRKVLQLVQERLRLDGQGLLRHSPEGRSVEQVAHL